MNGLPVAAVLPVALPDDQANRLSAPFDAHHDQATANHVGRRAAILIDGDVVMAPTLSAPIGASAAISGDFSRAEAERIVNGIGVRWHSRRARRV